MDEFLCPIFEDIIKHDSLVLMGKGLGLDRLIWKVIRCFTLQPSYSLGSKAVEICPQEQPCSNFVDVNSTNIYDVEENSNRTIVETKEANSQVKRNIVFCLNLSDEIPNILSFGLEDGLLPSQMPKIVTTDCSIVERQSLYELGGCFIVTSRILIVDILDKRIDVGTINGFIVANGHLVNESSMEAFILRLFRDSNRDGFIKAFSDDIETLGYKTDSLETCMKYLYLRRLSLWPRYHSTIDRALATSPCDVEEFLIPMSTRVKNVHASILIALKLCLSELKKSHPNLDIEDFDSSSSASTTCHEFSLAGSLYKRFDFLLRSKLEPDWHQVSIRSKSLINDLATLRTFMDQLLLYDACSFDYYLNRLKISVSSNPLKIPLWMLSEAGSKLFAQSRERIFQVVPSLEPSLSSLKDEKPDLFISLTQFENLSLINRIHYLKTLLQLNLVKLKIAVEYPRKWKVFKEIMENIIILVSNREMNSSSCEMSPVVVVMVQDSWTALQVQEILDSSEQDLKETRYRWWIDKSAREISSRKLTVVVDKSSSSSSLLPMGLGLDASQDLSSLNAILDSVFSMDLSGLMQLQVSDRLILVEHYRIKEENKLLKIDAKMTRNRISELVDAQEERLEMSSFFAKKSQGSKSSKKGEFMEGRNSRDKSHGTSMDGDNKVIDDGDEIALREDLEDDEEEAEKVVEDALMKAQLDIKRSGSKRKIDELNLVSEDESEVVQSNESKCDQGFKKNECFSRQIKGLTLHIITQKQLNQTVNVLEHLRPSHVVLFDVWIEAIRRVEIYEGNRNSLHREMTKHSNEATNSSSAQSYQRLFGYPIQPTKVYFLQYENSGEQFRYLNSLKREKSSFEQLNAKKDHLVILFADPRGEVFKAQKEDREGNNLMGLVDSRKASWNSVFLASSTNTKAKNVSRRHFTPGMAPSSMPQINAEYPSIVVDIREFRCSLPFVLYSHGFNLIPRTLLVGDYVLSNDICVERKGISDLFQSLASGRLYQQLEAMQRHYKTPCLLIEFQADHSFLLQAPSDIPNDILSSNVITKLSVMCHTFPSLRILWSRCPQETASIWKELLLNVTASTDTSTVHSILDVDQIVAKGSRKDGKSMMDGSSLDEEGEGQDTSSSWQDAEIRYQLREFLLALPGVNTHNIHDIFACPEIRCLRDFCRLSERQLAQILGVQNAKKLKMFLLRKG